MKLWRSYDGSVILAWLSVVVLVVSLREAALSEDTVVVRIACAVLVTAVVLLVFALYLRRRMKRRAEDKVRRADPILLSDIRTLAKSNSRYLNGAMVLRHAQMEEGESPGD